MSVSTTAVTLGQINHSEVYNHHVERWFHKRFPIAETRAVRSRNQRWYASVPEARTCNRQRVTWQDVGYPMHTECCYQAAGREEFIMWSNLKPRDVWTFASPFHVNFDTDRASTIPRARPARLSTSLHVSQSSRIPLDRFNFAFPWRR